MARRIISLKIWRKIHHVSSVIALGLLIFYWFTGYVMSHRSWFPEGRETETIRTEALGIPFDSTDHSSFLQDLKAQHQLRGRIQAMTRSAEGTWSTWMSLPGVAHQLTILPDKDSLLIRTYINQHFVEVSDRLHHIRGFHGGNMYVVWGMMIDLLVLALLVFAMSGVVLWYRLTKAYRFGGWVLVLSSALTIGILFWIWLV